MAEPSVPVGDDEVHEIRTDSTDAWATYRPLFAEIPHFRPLVSGPSGADLLLTTCSQLGKTGSMTSIYLSGEFTTRTDIARMVRILDGAAYFERFVPASRPFTFARCERTCCAPALASVPVSAPVRPPDPVMEDRCREIVRSALGIDLPSPGHTERRLAMPALTHQGSPHPLDAVSPRQLDLGLVAEVQAELVHVSTRARWLGRIHVLNGADGDLVPPPPEQVDTGPPLRLLTTRPILRTGPPRRTSTGPRSGGAIAA